MDRIKCQCIHCGAKMGVAANFAGRPIQCPKCQRQTPVPEAGEEGDVALEGTGKKHREVEEPLEAWWPDGVNPPLAAETRRALREARGLIEDERWKKAVEVLGPACKGAGERDAKALRRPSAFALTGFCRARLRKLKESEAGLSDKLHNALYKAAEAHKWGGTLDPHECGACEKRLKTHEGALKVRTVAGPLYLCCMAPTGADVELVQTVDLYWQLLTVAARVYPEDQAALALQAKLPWWYRTLLTREFQSAWCSRVIGETPRPDWWGICARILVQGAAEGAYEALTK